MSSTPQSPRHPAVVAATAGLRGDDGADDVPMLVPARMVNEFTYCPRLFFLEWVESRFTHNDDTRIGAYEHRAVDQEKGAAPLPEERPLIEARSVLLSSERLGMVARVDVLEGDADGVVTPVDFKKGRPPEHEDRAWEPERVQLCVQGLLLRDAGYTCTSGVLYYAETRERVLVPFTDDLVTRTFALLDELRQVASSETPPPPLVASPKCPRCSLVGICLPDETNALAARSEMPVRRLTPRDPESRPLYVSEHGAYVGVRGGRIEVTKDREPLASIRLIDIAQLCVFGNAQVSTQLVRELMSREVPICWFSYGGWFSGMTHGLPAKHVELRRRQMARAHDAGLPIARQMVEGKIRNSRVLLRRNTRDRPESKLKSLGELASRAGDAQSVGTLLGIEGAAARLYFEAFPTMLSAKVTLPGGPFTFEGRNRRPPLDAINCLLSYVYSLLVKDLTVQAFVVGFDPYFGFYHRPRFGRPALALDLAEEFRPLIAESVVIGLVNNGEIRPSHFVVRAGGVALTTDGRRRVFAGYERRLDTEIRHPIFGYKASYRRVLDVQVRLLGAHVMGEIRRYVPFITR
ncbi:MAG: CRISPR-associated endonuclease Cas4g/Cas1g [Actinomycetota bacterium]